MTRTPFPTVTAVALPTAALRAPLPVSTAAPAPSAPPADPATTDSTQDVSGRVSADIARAVRQRRYTR